ncbi:epoxide hydrolase family protein SPAR_M00020 [Saccharomyces paradoxus]|uniref:Epoxide hydrolase family protein n=1 Tax=Saccharomyces paradoxus TaxID=27291 RepID=A0A8B8UWP6_SACPA|nr:uncharacterized protein SPAR_M00020 [Saccharomyces paradoxus]QHS75157.1 hypothetical protein SPAR_M00020 [Saccharomyces paradoxus]
MGVEEFSIHVSENELKDLKRRLSSARIPKNVERKNWDFGTNAEYLAEVINYWKNSYDWRNIEQKLNGFHHFQTTISNIRIHYIHEKGKSANSIPIILTHGWPDSFLRYTKLIPLLTDPEKFGVSSGISFDVVIPSLPGFGFSDYPAGGSINNDTISDIWLELMKNKLGYDRFLAAGGDIGSGVTRYLGFKYPQNLIGIHLTDVGIIRDLLNQSQLQSFSSEEQEYCKIASDWLDKEAGYMKIQSTKPQTLAFGLTDSPVGLAAWILEKFHSWRDLQTNLPLDDIITNIMIYWFGKNIYTATRVYYENSHFLNPIGTIEVPTGICLFPKDILLPPRKWVEAHLNVVHWGNVQKGGHFTSMENPEEYAADLFLFLDKLR